MCEWFSVAQHSMKATQSSALLCLKHMRVRPAWGPASAVPCPHPCAESDTDEHADGHLVVSLSKAASIYADHAAPSC